MTTRSEIIRRSRALAALERHDRELIGSVGDELLGRRVHHGFCIDDARSRIHVRVRLNYAAVRIADDDGRGSVRSAQVLRQTQ